MKILWILPGSSTDKQNMIFAKRAIPALLNAGIEVEEFYLESRKSLSYLVKAWIMLRKKLQREKFDAIHGQYGSILGLFTWSLSAPYFLTIRGSDLNGDPQISWLRRTISISATHWSARHAKRVICVSKELSDKLMVPSDVLSSPLNLTHFSPIPMDIARKKLSLHFQGPLIGFAGGDRPLKRKNLAREACQKAGFNFLEIEKVSPEEMPFWINACSALILTSEKEGSPNIVKEALACGVPVISVDVGDVRKWLSQDPYSKIAEADSSALALALKQHASENPERKRRADLSELSLEVYAQKLGQIYRKYLP